MNPISTIENFDGADGFFGQEARGEEGVNHKGHEGTRRKTLGLSGGFPS
jgi:hypothetical protein